MGDDTRRYVASPFFSSLGPRRSINALIRRRSHFPPTRLRFVIGARLFSAFSSSASLPLHRRAEVDRSRCRRPRITGIHVGIVTVIIYKICLRVQRQFERTATTTAERALATKMIVCIFFIGAVPLRHPPSRVPSPRA